MTETPQRLTPRDRGGEFPLPPGDYLLQLTSAMRTMRDTALDAQLRPHGLTASRYRVLGVLNQFGACTMSEMANFTAMDRTTLTRIADQLVVVGWVERKAAPKDRRQVLLELTGLGRNTYLAAVKIVFAYNKKILEDIPEEAHRATARVLKALVVNLAPNDHARDSIIHFSREALKPAKADMG